MWLFFFNDTATTEIYTLSLHDALPIWRVCPRHRAYASPHPDVARPGGPRPRGQPAIDHEPSVLPCAGRRALPRQRQRSEEHTSELQSRPHLVCRLLLETKQSTIITAAL